MSMNKCIKHQARGLQIHKHSNYYQWTKSVTGVWSMLFWIQFGCLFEVGGLPSRKQYKVLYGIYLIFLTGGVIFFFVHPLNFLFLKYWVFCECVKKKKLGEWVGGWGVANSIKSTPHTCIYNIQSYSQPAVFKLQSHSCYGWVKLSKYNHYAKPMTSITFILSQKITTTSSPCYPQLASQVPVSQCSGVYHVSQSVNRVSTRMNEWLLLISFKR